MLLLLMLLGLNLQFRLWSEHLERRIYNRNRQIGWSQCQQVDHHLVGKRSLTLISMRLDHLLRPSNFFFFKLRKFVYKAVFGNLRRKKSEDWPWWRRGVWRWNEVWTCRRSNPASSHSHPWLRLRLQNCFFFWIKEFLCLLFEKPFLNCVLLLLNWRGKPALIYRLLLVMVKFAGCLNEEMLGLSYNFNLRFYYTQITTIYSPIEFVVKIKKMLWYSIIYVNEKV